jgi:hypothetical protein
MLEITATNTIVFAVLFGLSYYLLVSLYNKKFVRVEFVRVFYYITIFSLFGIVGEVFVNNIYEMVFGSPLWEYRIFPAHGGDISYFFIFIWGLLGFYKYINDTAVHTFSQDRYVFAGLVMGAEAIFLELLYNGLFLILFNEYIFYYLPANLGPLSHLSCLQVIPFYFVFGLFVNKLINQQDKLGYINNVLFTLAFFWLIIIVFIFF